MKRLISKGIKEELSEEEITKIESSNNLNDIYLAVKMLDDENITKKMVQKLKSSDDPKYIYWAGYKWPGYKASSFSKELLKTKDCDYIFLACRYWPNTTFTKELSDYVLKEGSDELLIQAVLSWPSDRVKHFPKDAIMQKRVNRLKEEINVPK